MNRRDLLKLIGLGGAAAFVVPSALIPKASAAPSVPAIDTMIDVQTEPTYWVRGTFHPISDTETAVTTYTSTNGRDWEIEGSWVQPASPTYSFNCITVSRPVLNSLPKFSAPRGGIKYR